MEEGQRENPEESPVQTPKARGPYKTYLRPIKSDDTGPSARKIPRTTVWRLKKGASLLIASDDQRSLSPKESALDQSFLNVPEEDESDDRWPELTDGVLHEEYEDNPRLIDADVSRVVEEYESDYSSDSENSTVDVGDALEPYVMYANSFGALHTALNKDYGLCIGKGTNRPGRGIEVTASCGEILQIVLTLASRHNFSNQATLDIVNGINTILSEDVLPKSQFGLDRLLFNPDNSQYFFYCLLCHEFLQEKADNVSIVQCKLCNHFNPVHELSSNNHFVMVDIKHQLELIFLDETLISKEDLLARYANGDSSLRDIYDGDMYKKYFESYVSKNTNSDETCISLSFCVDGTPLYKSSNTSIWPIIAILNEIVSPKARMKRVILIGLWYGSQKPKMDVFLQQFSTASKRNETEGMDISFRGYKRKLKIHTLACCVDSGARGSVQGVSQHNGTCACNWCYQNGIEVNKATRYPISDIGVIKERSRKQHEADCRKLLEALDNGIRMSVTLALATGGVRAVTPLMTIPSFHVIHGMICDYMHASLLGVAKAFLTTWLVDAEHESYIGSPNSVTLMNERLCKITRCTEMRRPPRPLTDIKHWKARELENWTLFYSVSVLKDVLDDKFYKHWIIYVQALHILLQTSITPEHLNVAERLIITFVNDTEKLYGVEQMSYNVHIHKHLVENVRRWGPLWAVNAFCFESYLGSLKKKVHANRGIQNQINRSLSRENAMKIIENTLPLSTKCKNYIATVRSYKSRNAKPDVERNGLKLYCRKSPVAFSTGEKWLMSNKGIDSNTDVCEEFCKARLPDSSCVIETRQSKRIRNDTFQLNDGKVVQVERIVNVVNKSCTFAFAKEVHTQPHLPQLYRELSRLNATAVKIATHVDESLKIVPLEEIRTVCYRSVDNLFGDVVISLPNVYNNV